MWKELTVSYIESIMSPAVYASYQQWLDDNPGKVDRLEDIIGNTATEYRSAMAANAAPVPSTSDMAVHESCVRHAQTTILFELKKEIGLSISESEKDNVRNLIYELMNIGVLIQNGNNDYYNTSYFHIKAFLETLEGPYKEFLTHILNNKFFGRICASHGGFGSNFENIIVDALLMKSKGENQSPILGSPEHLDLRK